MNDIKRLLQQVSLIQKKYDDLAEYSGEHYNVFDILGVATNELSHSAILTNLLDANGKHGQKDLFLKLFLELFRNLFLNDEENIGLKLKNRKTIENFNTINSHAIKEKHTGRVDFDTEQGGRIDIIINDGKSNIIIENKIYAGDQHKQLVRYYEHDKNAPILYLTLDGKVPSKGSIGNLKLNEDFVCISYATFIIQWLENCVKEMANKPIIRETLNQYLFLIKNLTNQSSNKNMEKEIHQIILTNYEAAKEISYNFNKAIIELSNGLFLSVLERLKVILAENNWVVQNAVEVIDGRSSGYIHFKPNNYAKNDWSIVIDGFHPIIIRNKDFGNRITIGVWGDNGMKNYLNNYLPIQDRQLSTGWWTDYIFLDNFNFLECDFTNSQLIEYLAPQNNRDSFVDHIVNNFITYFKIHKNNFEKMTEDFQRDSLKLS